MIAQKRALVKKKYRYYYGNASAASSGANEFQNGKIGPAGRTGTWNIQSGVSGRSQFLLGESFGESHAPGKSCDPGRLYVSFAPKMHFAQFQVQYIESAAYHEAGHISAAVVQRMPLPQQDVHIDLKGCGISH